MSELFSSSPIALRMLRQALQPTLCISDMDGTLFTPDLTILTAPWANYKLASFLKKNSIPLVIATGRSDWEEIDKMQLSLLGISLPKIVITACGTIIYELLSNNLLARDVEWENHMHYTKVTWMDGTVETWNKLNILNVIEDYLHDRHFPYQVGKGNTFLIRLKVKNIKIKNLEEIRKDILSLFPKGVRVIFTEKLLWKNTEEIFSGDILIVPKDGGKENAIRYLLKKYSQALHTVVHADIFGDATVDVGMLTMNPDSRYYSLSQYLIHPTPLAKKAVLPVMKTNQHIHIIPQFQQNQLIKIIQNNGKEKRDFSSEFLPIQQGITENSKEYQNEKPVEQTTKTQAYFSPAQNNPIRMGIKIMEPLLDRLVDKKLSPNEVSFLGLTKLSEGLNQIYKKTSFGGELKGLYNYGFGNLTDVLDGIRARRSDSSRHSERSEETPGQLVDGFSDRAKEFMQLFIRGKKRLETNPDEGLQTLLIALSCALPSIARAQVEITGKTVSERDEKGGSMIDRTKNLFISLLMDTIGVPSRSFIIDQQIYSSNMATFRHRLSAISKTTEKSPPLLIKDIKLSSLSDFQRKALERWLLYIDVLQQEDAIVKKYLSKQPKLLQDYEKQSQKLAKDYLELKVNSLRKKWHIKNYQLELKRYI